jgi:hypothetical protein
MSLRENFVVDLTSDAAATVESRWIRAGNAKVTIHVVTGPGAVVAIQGNSGPGTNAVNLTYIGAAGVTALAGLAAGVIYEVRERPEWIRVQTAIDGGGARAYRVILTFDMEEND